MVDSKTVWGALIEVKLDSQREAPPDFENIPGAFVNGVTLAVSTEEAVENFVVALSNWGFLVVKFDELDLFQERLTKYNVPEEMRLLAASVEKKGGTKFSEFYVWDEDR